MHFAVETHWSFFAKSCHEVLQRVENELSVDYPSAALTLLIDYANLATSHTMGPDGFTSAILALGPQPRLLTAEYKQMPQTDTNGMNLTTSERRDYEAIVSQLCVSCAMNTASPNESVI